jgi:small subunit ribosomal protein S16
VAVKIRLKRLGKIRAPYYRVVIADSRTKRDGRSIEEIGQYHPTEEPSLIKIDSERAQYWLGVGAQPTEQVLALLKITGDWQTFKGLPGTEGTLRVAAPRVDRAALFAAATQLTHADDVNEGATTAKKKSAKKVGSAPAAKAEPAGKVEAEAKVEAKAEAAGNAEPEVETPAEPTIEAVVETPAETPDALVAPQPEGAKAEA